MRLQKITALARTIALILRAFLRFDGAAAALGEDGSRGRSRDTGNAVVAREVPASSSSTNFTSRSSGGLVLTCTDGAMNRYPRLGTVSMNTGFSEESPSVSRSLMTDVFKLWSKSTKVWSGQSR